MKRDFSTTPEELFALIGELHFINHRLEQENIKLQKALEEAKNGRLDKSNNHDAV